MHRAMGSKSGYAQIAQAEEEEGAYHDEPQPDAHRGQPTLSTSDTHFAPIQPARRPPMQPYREPSTYAASSSKRRHHNHNRNRSNSAVDIKAINARLEKWADEIAAKFRLRTIKGKSTEEEKLEIHYSVFQAPDDIRPASAETLATTFMQEPENHMSKLEFDDVVESVKIAIELGMQPKMITQGSSGSYFAQNSEGKVVGVFKPKDEEPYATRNPKWTKWLHRNLFPFAFGRACLIPNLSYVSEAAAYVLDTRLRTNIVPYTDIVYLSSTSFNNDFWDRRAYYRNRKPLPAKVGSFQVFLKGFQDATIFLKAHPWPDQPSSTTRALSRGRRRTGWVENCRTGATPEEEDGDGEELDRSEMRGRGVFWTNALQQSLREQLEKLVILDYIMRNTDRGLDNWMIRIDQETQEARIVAKPPKANGLEDGADPYQPEQPMTSGSNSPSHSDGPAVSLGAIDNSLSWPWKHPDAWRSFPFGWLFLPVSLIGQPFTQKTREHFLPLLTSKQWWSETQVALRECFSQDSDFKERMFARQIAVMKGQAWNVVETLKAPEHGPLELTRRARVCVWDDLIDIPIIIPLRESTDETRFGEAKDMPGQSSRKETGDISAAYGSGPPTRTYDPLSSPESPSAAIPSSARFNVSRHSSTEDARLPIPLSPKKRTEMSPPGRTDSRGSRTIDRLAAAAKIERPNSARSKTSNARVSYDMPRTNWHKENARKRNSSFTFRRLSIGEESEDDGDLGYAAARDMEGNRKKVIVERLETIKANPFFTWC